MSAQSLRAELERAESQGSVLRPKRPVPLEAVGALLAYSDGGPALVAEVEGFSLPVVGNVCNSRPRMAASLGTTEEDLVPALGRSVTGAISPVVVARAPCQERSTALDLTSLPVPRFFERETAPYITAGAIVAQHPVTKAANFSFARLKVLGPRKAMLGVSPNHHLGRLAALAAEGGEGLPIAVTLGNHPAVMLSACLYLGFGDDELRCAGALLGEPLRVAQCETSSLLVPAEAEVVLEGIVDPSHRIEEGAVSEYHGHYHEYGAGYEVEFQRLTMRSDAMFQVVLPGLFREHILLGGVAIAAVLERNLRELAPNLVSVAVPETGAGRTAAVICLDRPRPGQARQLMMAAFALVPLIKQVTVVDPDVDPWDAGHVEWARMVRSRPERDLLIVSGARTDRSEPLNVDGVVGKLGIDATARETDRPTGPWLARLPAPALEAAARALADEGGLGQFPPTLGRSVGGAY